MTLKDRKFLSLVVLFDSRNNKLTSWQARVELVSVMWQPARLISSHMPQLIIACNAERRKAAIRNRTTESFKKQECGLQEASSPLERNVGKRQEVQTIYS